MPEPIAKIAKTILIKPEVNAAIKAKTTMAAMRYMGILSKFIKS